VLCRGKLGQQAGDLGDPVCAGDGVRGATEDGGVVDVDGVSVYFIGKACEVMGVVVERLWNTCKYCISPFGAIRGGLDDSCTYYFGDGVVDVGSVEEVLGDGV
jgi:hypothetical protein